MKFRGPRDTWKFAVSLTAGLVFTFGVIDAVNGAETHVVPVEVLKAFEAVCLESAPSFADAPTAAAQFGITELTEVSGMKVGFSEEENLGVQIKSGKECVVTAAYRQSRSLTKEFMELIARHAGAEIKSVPAKARIRGVAFLFMHDRTEGEALIMLKEGG